MTDSPRPERAQTSPVGASTTERTSAREATGSLFHVRPASRPMAPMNSVGRLLWLAEIVGNTPGSVTEEGAAELARGVEHLLVALDKIAKHSEGDTGWWAANVAKAALRGERG